MKMQTILAILVFLLPTLIGCGGVFSTGPQIAERTGQVAGDAVQALLTSFQPKEMTAGADGSVTNPEYVFDLFIGAGTYVRGSLKLNGANLQFDVDSAGTGVEIDREAVIAALATIDKELPVDQRDRELRKLLADALAGGAVRKSNNEPGVMVPVE